MSFDGVFTHLMVQELNQVLEGGRISKIHQPYDNELILIIRNQGKNHKLLLSVHPTYARVQLTEMVYQNPAVPPNFCMTLRKHMEGALIQSLEQIENDRIIHLHFTKRNELGDLENLVLIIELMGRHSSIILVNQQEEKILDCIKHIGPSQNSYRLLLPGATYQRPPVQENQWNPWQVPKEKLFEILSTSEWQPQTIQQHFQGIGKLTAKELIERLNQSPQDKLTTWLNFFNQLTTQLQPTLTSVNQKEFFTPIPYVSLGNEYQNFSSLSQLLDNFYEGKAEKERVKQQGSQLIRQIQTNYKKTVNKLKKLEKELNETENAEIYRQKGELLTTYLHLVEKGTKEITLENYYEENQPIHIQLREDLSPSQNAQKYFHKYAKLKNGVKKIQKQLEETKQEKYYLESVLSQLEIASPMDLEVIREELIEEKIIRNRNKQAKHKKKKPSQPEKYLSSDGTSILVGKNNLQNDKLTLKTARKTDIWLHAKDIPGSHVIIEHASPSNETLEEAAILAAYFSKYQLSNKVPVDYVSVKHVKKPNGAKPGFVIYDNQQTLFVTPTKKIVENLRNNAKSS
ncbi:NFACT RNA binding domain-containing protein [Vagococcus humatus]|uniref:Rqc2 homolog RqcH n=1 Tax=Vagococcus humatus TaxID=1889241 RepID=A0A429Z7J0_9ENTE|nr:NFACT RNA binding domain-containing protein [Vagococcus humatus]RST89661.1 hypothetical protein C7P63_00865 [Vagococcus humatus]